MKLSLYTFVRNGLKYDFHVVEMLKHHLPLVDELIVNEGYSTDGTFERITNIDPKIKVFQTRWGEQTAWSGTRQFKNQARKRCTGDWCVYLDCDEFIPEWQFEPLRRRLADTAEDLIAIDVINFYANYRVFHANPEKPPLGLAQAGHSPQSPGHRVLGRRVQCAGERPGPGVARAALRFLLPPFRQRAACLPVAGEVAKPEHDLSERPLHAADPGLRVRPVSSSLGRSGVLRRPGRLPGSAHTGRNGKPTGICARWHADL